MRPRIISRHFLHASFLLLLASGPARPWGERGHHATARLAASQILVGVDLAALPDGEAELYKNLRDLFRQKAIQLGHISNIPDTAWRSLNDEGQALNAPTHFSDSEHWTDDFNAIPLDYPSALAKFHGKPSRLNGRPVDLFETGTLIWRAQELYDLMVRELRKAAAATHPADIKADVHRALVYGGLLAHFIADATMPYHNSDDYDGYGTGNGGVHAYFETDFPNTESIELERFIEALIPKQYQSHAIAAKFVNGGQKPGAFMARELSAQAFGRIPELRKLDDNLILERSKPSAEEGSKSAPAKRKGPEEAGAFRPMVTEQIALGASALARLWRGAWEEAGKPDLSKAKSWDYAHKPDFIIPAYDHEAILRIQKKIKKSRKDKKGKKN